MRSTAGVLICAFLSSFCFAVALASATTQRSFSPADFPGTFPRGAVACRVGTAPGQRNPSKEWAISFGFVDSSGGTYSFGLNFAANRTTGSPVHEQDHISRAGGPPLDIYVGFTSFVPINTTGVGLLFSWDYTLLH